MLRCLFHCLVVLLIPVIAWGSTIGGSLSVRKARVENLPFDFEWTAYTKLSWPKSVILEGRYQWERDTGEYYTDQEYAVSWAGNGGKLGTKLVNSEEHNVYSLSFFVEKEYSQGPTTIGFGTSTIYTDKWLKGREHFLRLSIQVKYPLGTGRVIYEIQMRNAQVHAYLDTRVLEVGPFEIVPFIQYDRFLTGSRWWAKVKTQYRWED